MSLTEAKRMVDDMSLEERLFLAAYLHHRLRADNPANRAILEERMREVDAGNKVTLEQAWRLHKALENEGL